MAVMQQPSLKFLPVPGSRVIPPGCSNGGVTPGRDSVCATRAHVCSMGIQAGSIG